MKSSNARRRSRLLRAGIGLLVVALALTAAVGIAAAKHKKKAKLHVSVPSSVANGATWSVKANGYSGHFDNLAVYAFFGSGCESTQQAMFNAGHTATNISVPKHHTFNKKAGFVAGNPGTHQACIYLDNTNHPSGTQLHKAVTYQVTP